MNHLFYIRPSKYLNSQFLVNLLQITIQFIDIFITTSHCFSNFEIDIIITTMYRIFNKCFIIK